MNKIPNFKQDNNEDLLPEYQFDYQKARPNRFTINAQEAKITVTLEPDVAKIFKTSGDVNKALKTIISAIPN